MIRFHNSWDEVLKDEFKKPYYKELHQFLKKEYETATIFPPMNDIFNAFKYADYKDIKVVILGQDPYHEKGQAHGLAFSVSPLTKIPPSLKNIYKEISAEYGYPIPTTGYLEEWAKQGVFLMNAVLTVREGEANSHKNKGWEIFTDHIIEYLNERQEPMVFMLWGNNAKQKEKLITNKNHLVLSSAHPSPLSAYNGFFGNGHFKKANDFLIKNYGKGINWKIEY